MRVYISSSDSSRLKGRKDPNRHIHFNNSNVYIAPGYCYKVFRNLHRFLSAMTMRVDKLLKNEQKPHRRFSSDHTRCPHPDVISITVM